MKQIYYVDLLKVNFKISFLMTSLKFHDMYAHEPWSLIID